MKPDAEQHKSKLPIFQRNEITEYHIYRNLAKQVKSTHNREILNRIAADELRHYHDWKKYTKTDVSPCRFKILKFMFISRIFGFTFAIKLMEKGEATAQINYRHVLDVLHIPDDIISDENSHEDELIEMLDEERLRYTGSIVLGLNDALVELTAALTGLTFALQNTSLIALTGIITGLAAALSMGVSEYLSIQSETNSQNPLKASLYTGSTYVMTVILLILPYLIFSNFYICLGFTLLLALLIIALFNYYISVARGLNFRKRFLEMAGLSLGVSLISFLIGVALRKFTGLEL